MKKLLIALSTVTALLLSTQAFSMTLLELTEWGIAEQTREVPVTVEITSEVRYGVRYINADGSTGEAECRAASVAMDINCTLTNKPR